MKPKQHKCLSICLAAGTNLLLLCSLLTAALNQAGNNTVNEECIGCHPSVFNEGIESSQQHVPFWERQCTVCHLEEGTSWSAQARSSATGPITGTVVDQAELWRKVQIYETTTGPVFGQLVSIPSLEMNTAYRFRMAVSSLAANTSGEVYKSLWLGLQPDELNPIGPAGQLDLSSGLVAPVSDFTSSTALYREGNTVYIAWETTQPLYGWAELQELDGVSLENLPPTGANSVPQPSATSEHPPLRDPEDLAIEACYQCHPESTLGASHPVRLYGGRDVRIPDELPTVEGMLTCVTCHNPHGAEGRMLVRETIKTKLCVACHYKYKNSSPSTMFD